MRKFLFLLIAAAVATGNPTQAQLTRLHNAPRGGDEIIKQRVDYKDPGRSGENVIWDFGQLFSIDPEYNLSYYDIQPVDDSTYLALRDTIPAAELLQGDLMAGVEHHTAYWLRMVEDTIISLGHENPVVLMKHNPPLLSMPFPFGYGQETEREYRSSGFYSSREPVVTEGNIHLKADAFGKMVLPSGDTLDHVLRIKSLQTIADADTTRSDSIPRLKMFTEYFRWFVKGYRYPVFETTRVFDVSDIDTIEIFGTAFFFPPLEHLYLEQDSANMAVLDSLWNIGIGIGYGGEGNEGGEEGDEGDDPPGNINLKYNYFPNPVAETLYVEYYFEATTTVTITLFDMNGLPVRILNKGALQWGLYQDEIECGTLAAGSYILMLNVGDVVETGVIMKK